MKCPEIKPIIVSLPMIYNVKKPVILTGILEEIEAPYRPILSFGPFLVDCKQPFIASLNALGGDRRTKCDD